jgi:unsaturated rhamnogalacturonyl hydrolase
MHKPADTATPLLVNKNRLAGVGYSDCFAPPAQMTAPFHSRVVQVAKAFRGSLLPALSVVLCMASPSQAWPQQLPASGAARGETVMLDAWFNSQQRQNAAGQKEYFHYKWNDDSDSGFSLFGQIFVSHGATLDTLYRPPTLKRLSGAQFYIIVSPDIPAKNPQPHYVQPQDADQIAEWVKQGGVLLLMENDPANADISHLNLIADRFGIHFDELLKHHVIGDQFAPGFIPVAGGGPVFQHPYTLYMKDTCAISLKGTAKALLEDKAGIVMATAKYGRGTVVAVVDPWLYNEYTDPRKLLPRQDNYAAGKEFVSWLLKQAQRDISTATDPHSRAIPTRDKDSQ